MRISNTNRQTVSISFRVVQSTFEFSTFTQNFSMRKHLSLYFQASKRFLFNHINNYSLTTVFSFLHRRISRYVQFPLENTGFREHGVGCGADLKVDKYYLGGSTILKGYV